MLKIMAKRSLKEVQNDVTKEELEQNITDLEIDAMEKEQSITDLEIAVIELQSKVNGEE